MVEPHIPGTPWLTERHGTLIRPSLHWSSVYDADRAEFARFCERNGIPTKDTIPVAVFDLAHDAWALRYEMASADRDARRAALLNEARALLAPVEERFAA